MKYILALIGTLFFIGCANRADIETIKNMNPSEQVFDLGAMPEKGFAFDFGYNSACVIEGYNVETDLLRVSLTTITNRKASSFYSYAMKLERHEPYVHEVQVSEDEIMCSEFIWTLEEDHIMLYVSSFVRNLKGEENDEGSFVFDFGSIN